MAGARIVVDEIAQEFMLGDGSIHPVLAGCSFAIEPGEFVSIVGPSGSGKTTLFNLIAGLATASTGAIAIDGTPVDGPSRRVAYMLQKDLLMPWRSALENVTLGLEIRGISRTVARARALAYLQRYGLGGFEHAYPATLSGGMRQRVALIRTLILDPEVVLLDEPFSALDEQNKTLLQEELLRIWEETKKTVLFITPSVDEAATLGDRIMVMTAHPGRPKALVDVPFPRRGGYAMVNRVQALDHMSGIYSAETDTLGVIDVAADGIAADGAVRAPRA